MEKRITKLFSYCPFWEGTKAFCGRPILEPNPFLQAWSNVCWCLVQRELHCGAAASSQAGETLLEAEPWTQQLGIFEVGWTISKNVGILRNDFRDHVMWVSSMESFATFLGPRILQWSCCYHCVLSTRHRQTPADAWWCAWLWFQISWQYTAVLQILVVTRWNFSLLSGMECDTTEECTKRFDYFSHQRHFPCWDANEILRFAAQARASFPRPA